MISGIESKIRGTGAAGALKDGVNPLQSKEKDGVKFGDTLAEQMEKSEDALMQAAKKAGVPSAPVALDAAAQKIEDARSANKPILKFSNHALERMNTRGIHFSPEQITKIEQGMQKAGEKGAKETLVLSEDSALIVSLKNNTVVTVMDKNMLRENVFTNIDSTVFV